jgi:hypothetical protein
MKNLFFVLVLTVLLGFGFAAVAQDAALSDAGTLPDSPFYFLKTWKESIQTFFTFGAEKKAEQYLHLAEVRLAEYQKMAEKGKAEAAQKTIEKYEEQLNRALEKAGEAKDEGRDVQKINETISETIIRHREVLGRVLEQVPEEAKKGIENAIEVSQRGFENAIQAVTGDKKGELERRAEETSTRIQERLDALKENLPEEMNKEEEMAPQEEQVEQEQTEAGEAAGGGEPKETTAPKPILAPKPTLPLNSTPAGQSAATSLPCTSYGPPGCYSCTTEEGCESHGCVWALGACVGLPLAEQTAIVPPSGPIPSSPEENNEPLPAPEPAPISVNGACGAANGGSFTVAPAASLCSSGTQTFVFAAGSQWQWTCTGSSGGADANCTASVTPQAPVVGGYCGSAQGGFYTSAPSSGLCSSGAPTAVTQSGSEWHWNCSGSSGGANSSCSADVEVIAPVNGVCGSSNLGTYSAQPTGLCNAGTATAVTQSNYTWHWDCNGSNGGTNAACQAEVEVRTPNYTVSLTRNGNDYSVNGHIDYYGKGSSCSGPRPYDPVIVRWGDAGAEPAVTNGSFSATHEYFIENATHNFSVSVYNSCYGVQTYRTEVVMQFDNFWLSQTETIPLHE